MSKNQNPLYFRLLLRMSDGTQVKTRTARKRKIARYLREKQWTEADLEVVYHKNGQEIGSNAGTYRSVEDALLAYGAFTEQELIAA